VTAADHRWIRKAARALHQSVSAFLTSVAMDRADKVLAIQAGLGESENAARAQPSQTVTGG